MTGNGVGKMAREPDSMIVIEGVTRRFGAKVALDDVCLTVPRGVVLGLVGENGAGKTTLIRHVLGLLKAATGSVRVFGLDPVTHPVEVLGRIGYLSEDRDLPGWMRVGELLRYTRAFYPSWDDAFAEELRRSFQLDPAARLKDLSQGQRARAGLLVALAYRPDLLVLDEPLTGLDPVVKRDILGRSSGRSPTRGGRSCSRRTCSRRWSGSRTGWRCSTRGRWSCRALSTRSRRSTAGSRSVSTSRSPARRCSAGHRPWWGRGETGRRSAGARSTRSRGRPARSVPGSWRKACRRSTRSSWLAWAPVASSRWRPDS